jgi:hypothetical protein
MAKAMLTFKQPPVSALTPASRQAHPLTGAAARRRALVQLSAVAKFAVDRAGDGYNM